MTIRLLGTMEADKPRFHMGWNALEHRPGICLEPAEEYHEGIAEALVQRRSVSEG